MARVEPAPPAGLRSDSLHVMHPRAAGLDVHKMQISAAVRLAPPRGGHLTATQEFSTLPSGLQGLTRWLLSHRIRAAGREGPGMFWKAPCEALEDAGIEPILCHARCVQPIRGRKSDVADSLWLARICQFGLCQPSYVSPRQLRQLRQLSRYRRKLVAERSRTRNRVHKTLDHDGVRLGGALVDSFGKNGRRSLDGLAAEQPPAAILRSLTGHVRPQRELLEPVLEAHLDAHGVWQLRDLLEAHDRVNASIERLDRRLQAGLAEHEQQVRLLGRCQASIGAAPAPLWWSWARICRPSRVPATWRLGPAWHRATTKVRASGARAGYAVATRRCGRR